MNFENRPPTPIPERSNITANKMDKPPIGRPKLKLPNKASASAVKNWRNVDKNEDIPKDVWKHFRRPPRSMNMDTMPDAYSVSSTESPTSYENYNPALDETIGQYDGTFDPFEDDSNPQVEFSSGDAHYSDKDKPVGSNIVTSTSSLESLDPKQDDDLMDSFSLILQESDTSEKSDKELVAEYLFDEGLYDFQRRALHINQLVKELHKETNLFPHIVKDHSLGHIVNIEDILQPNEELEYSSNLMAK